MKPNTVLTALLLIIASSLYAAEGTDSSGQPGSHRSASPDGASVGFSNIADGDVLPTVFTVRFAVSGMGIAPAGVEIDNTGHHHLLIDVAEMPDFNQPLPATDKIRHFGKGQTETEVQLVEGQHTLQVLFADYRHIPHEPPVMSEIITVEVSADAPAQADSESD